jgi:hypothetical protein
MDRGMQLRHLEQAERQVVEGERLVFDQEQRVVALDLEGHDTAEARKLLRTFRASREEHIAHRDMIRSELEK